MEEKIGVGALKDIKIFYKGDIYDLALITIIEVLDISTQFMGAGYRNEK